MALNYKPTLKNKLELLSEYAGTTLKEVCKESGVSAAAYYTLANTDVISSEDLKKIADFFGIDAFDLALSDELLIQRCKNADVLKGYIKELEEKIDRTHKWYCEEEAAEFKRAKIRAIVCYVSGHVMGVAVTLVMQLIL